MPTPSSPRSSLSDESAENPDILDTIFAWKVTLEQIYLEAIAWRSIRTLRQIRQSQIQKRRPRVSHGYSKARNGQRMRRFSIWRSPPSYLDYMKHANFANLPKDVFERIIIEIRHATISHAKPCIPFEMPPVCFCTSPESAEKSMLQEKYNAVEAQWRAFKSAKNLLHKREHMDTSKVTFYKDTLKDHALFSLAMTYKTWFLAIFTPVTTSVTCYAKHDS